MQQIMYDEAPYHVLYYPSQLDANRTDKFGGWKNQPSQNGNPLFGFGSLDYTYLTDAKAVVPSASPSSASSSTSPGPSEAAVASAPAPTSSAAPDTTGTTSGSTPLLPLGIIALVVIVAVGFVVIRRRREAAEEE